MDEDRNRGRGGEGAGCVLCKQLYKSTSRKHSLFKPTNPLVPILRGESVVLCWLALRASLGVYLAGGHAQSAREERFIELALVRGSINSWMRRARSRIGGLDEKVRWDGSDRSGCPEKPEGRRLHRSPRPETGTWTKHTARRLTRERSTSRHFAIQNLERRQDDTQTYIHTIRVRWGFRAAFAACTACCILSCVRYRIKGEQTPQMTRPRAAFDAFSFALGD